MNERRSSEVSGARNEPASERRTSLPANRFVNAFGWGAISAGVGAHGAAAQDTFGTPLATPDHTGLAQLALLIGTIGACAFFAWRLATEKRKLAAECTALRERSAGLARDNSRLATLADARDRRVVLWSNAGDGEGPPALFGDLPDESGAPNDRATFLGFGRWLRSHSAGLLDHALQELRAYRKPFDITVETMTGTPLEVEGRAGGGGHFVRFLPAHSSRRKDVELRAMTERLKADLERHNALWTATDYPAWTRSSTGALDRVNEAYARAVGAASPDEAVANGIELFGAAARDTINKEIDASDTASYSGRASSTVGGSRRIFSVEEARTPVGSAGMAVDVTAVEDAEGTLTRTRRAHAETLDQLATAVASFDSSQRMTHCNNAFANLFGLDRAFLEQNPSNAAVLDRLRADEKLADKPDWNRERDETLSVYHATEPREYEWQLLDGRTLRVVAAPQEGGGVTWLFENVTERRKLEHKARELQHMRDATLEHLSDGVAVFGPDGRLRLANPAFGELWGLTGATRETGAHVSSIASACADRHETPSTLWADLSERVTGFSEARTTAHGQVRLVGGIVLSWRAQPLPGGHTLLTFVDVSDTQRVADALSERNEAMERADAMKRNFMGHISYELRSPLTNIIGFTDLLSSEIKGPISEAQAEYLGYIQNSSEDLLETVDEIIDLSTIDAGAMQLDYADVGVEEVVAAAVKRVENRLDDHDLVLDVHADTDLGTIEADADRLVQVLRNLLLNAIEHTGDGGTLRLSVSRQTLSGVSYAAFAVSDSGPGIPEGDRDRVFEPFFSQKGGGRKRGPGLGLAVVKAFVNLHGGHVQLVTGSDGTTVSCLVPVDRPTEPVSGGTSVLQAEPVRLALPGDAKVM